MCHPHVSNCPLFESGASGRASETRQQSAFVRNGGFWGDQNRVSELSEKHMIFRIEVGSKCLEKHWNGSSMACGSTHGECRRNIRDRLQTDRP